RLAGGGHREVGASVMAPHVLGVHVLGRVEALDLAGDVDLERLGVEQRDAVDARASGNQRVPARLCADADRRDDAVAGDDHAPRGHAGSPSSVASQDLPAGASTWCVPASGLMRRMRPESTRPGPTSTKSVTPSATMWRTVVVHCTPWTRCSVSSMRSPSAVLMTVP